MAKFHVASTVPCFVTWHCEIEAETADKAKAKFRNGDYEFEGAPDIGDSLDSADEEITVEVVRPKFYECGICGHCHPAEWNGDCREDAARFTNQQLDDKYGQDGWQEVPMPGIESDAP